MGQEKRTRAKQKMFKMSPLLLVFARFLLPAETTIGQVMYLGGYYTVIIG